MNPARLLADRYRLDSELGRGAMGTVWNAYDQVLRRRVAIKEVRLPAGIPAHESEQIADRTLREARAIAALSHPHVITLFDILPLDSGPAIVMELMLARSLAEILAADGPMNDVRAAAVGHAVALGLQAAHAAGITHRDVKPANELIAADGRIKLTDFGIARSADEQTLTATGMLLGSPAYISPEVAAGRPATPSADLWGLGALLFAAVENHPPFDAGNPIATLTAVVSNPVPPHPHSGRLGPLIDGLLVKDPQHRLPLGEVITRLAAIAGPIELAGLATPTRSGAQTAPPAGATTEPENRDPNASSPFRFEAAAPVRSTQSAPSPLGSREVKTVATPHWPGVFGDDERLNLARPPALPPPPWEAAAAERLPALPGEASTGARRRWPLLLAALAVGVAAAAAGYFLVTALVHLAG